MIVYNLAPGKQTIWSVWKEKCEQAGACETLRVDAEFHSVDTPGTGAG